MNILPSPFLLWLAIAVPVLLMLGFAFGWRAWSRRDERRSPLNFKVLNLPGDSLRKRLEALDDEFNEAGMLVIITGPVMLAGWAINVISRRGWETVQWQGGDWMFVLGVVGMTAWATRRIVRTAGTRRRYREGLAAEIATAQNLIPLLGEGCVVFHDFPGDGFNIDHIVVAPNAVFAVETKSRRKPAKGGKDSARVAYDGKTLRFPDHVETRCVEQAQRQAHWLAQWLGSATGQPVPVIPVLALPGWFIEPPREWPQVIVSNLRSPLFLTKLRAPLPMDATLVRRVAHALAERYPKAD